MVAFAANSLFCRLALKEGAIDPASFTTIRLASGAIALLLIISFGHGSRVKSVFNLDKNTALQGGALLAYALFFSIAYIGLATGTGALVLFGSVQITMLLIAYLKGERFSVLQWLGFGMASGGIICLLLPGADAPSVLPAVSMIVAGIAWGVYTILGKGVSAPVVQTGKNFLFASLIIVPLMLGTLLFNYQQVTWQGSLYAILSGVFASGCGYAIWYSALPRLKVTLASTLQLSVPVIATFMGWLFINESVSTLMLIASSLTLFGVAIVISARNSN